MCTNCPDWLPQSLSAQMGALAPGGVVVDMAYSCRITARSGRDEGRRHLGDTNQMVNGTVVN